MKALIPKKEARKTYIEPHQRTIMTYIEQVFLQSNLEPIDGGDDPDIDW